MIQIMLAFMEGIVTLGMEIYAIRRCASVIGSSINVTGVVLGVILIALSIGYWQGSKEVARHAEKEIKAGKEDHQSIPGMIARRLALAALGYAMLIPLHQPLMEISYQLLGQVEIPALISSLLYVPSIILGSSILPLLAHRKTTDAGRFLAISTIGSVTGSTLTPIVLLPQLGLNSTGSLLIIVLIGAALLALWWQKRAQPTRSQTKPATTQESAKQGAVMLSEPVITGLILILASVIGLSQRGDGAGEYHSATQSWKIIETSVEGKKVRALQSGPGLQSGVTEDGEPAFAYIKEMGHIIQEKVPAGNKVTVLGSAGLVLPDLLSRQGYQVQAVDIDPSSLKMAEKLLGREVASLKFIAKDARAWLRQEKQKGDKQDAIIIDTFIQLSIPAHMMTKEALQEARQLSPLVIQNVIFPAEESKYRSKVLATWQSVFPEGEVRKIGKEKRLSNHLLCSKQCGGQKISSLAGINQKDIYTDDRSSSDIDSIKLWH